MLPCGETATCTASGAPAPPGGTSLSSSTATSSESWRRFQNVLIVVRLPAVVNVTGIASFQSAGSPSMVGLKYGALVQATSWRRVTVVPAPVAEASIG